MAEAAQTYTILTVGDGLVGQIPALIISTSAGLLVTRSTGEKDFGTDLKDSVYRAFHCHLGSCCHSADFCADSGTAVPAISDLLHLARYPWLLPRQDKRSERVTAEIEKSSEPVIKQEENYEEMLNVDLLELEVGYGLIPFVDSAQDGELLSRIQSIRKQFAIKQRLHRSANSYQRQSAA